MHLRVYITPGHAFVFVVLLVCGYVAFDLETCELNQ